MCITLQTHWQWVLAQALHQFVLWAVTPWSPGALLEILRIFTYLHWCLISCHNGNILRYDTVTKLGWSVSARTHGIQVIIDSLLSKDWESGDNDTDSRQVPAMVDEDDCIVCFLLF